MKFDRGFIKWQPFNSVTSSKEILNNLNKKIEEKPVLFPEKLENLNNIIIDAYYSKNRVIISFYEENKIKEIETVINRINTTSKTIVLNNHKTIAFSQIINIKTI